MAAEHHDATARDGDPLVQFERDRLALFAARGFDGRSRRIPGPSGRETYAITRDDESTPTLLIHGGSGIGTEWADMANRLDGTVVIVDRPGFGLSDRRDDRGVDFKADAARWLVEVVDGLGAEQVNVVGASMGGFFAMAFAAAHPERTRRLVLTGAPVGLFREMSLFLRLMANPLVGPVVSRLKIRNVEMMRKRVYGPYLAHPERVPADVLEVALAGMSLPGTPPANHETLRAVTTFRGLRPALSMDGDMAGLDVPTLFVWGDEDRIAPAGVGGDLSRRMTDARLTIVDDAGHIPHMDQPRSRRRRDQLVRGRELSRVGREPHLPRPGLRRQARAAFGYRSCCVGRTRISLTATWRGPVTMYRIASAMSSARSG